MFHISEITSSHALLYKSFFLQGLIDDEDNFRISPHDEMLSPFPTLDQVDSFTLGAFVNKEWAGVVSFERDGATREKLRHKGTLFRMLVGKEYRGHGLGKQLIQAVIERVKRHTDIEQINLTVIADNTGAKKLYESFGFRTFSAEERAIKWKGRYFTEEQMVLRLR